MAAYIVRGDEYSVLGLVAPLLGWLSLGVSPLVWNASIKKCESTHWIIGAGNSRQPSLVE